MMTASWRSDPSGRARRGIDMIQQTDVRRALRIIAAVALFVALVPSLSGTVDPINGPADLEFRNSHPDVKPGQTVLTLGWPASPLFHFQKETRIVAQGDGLASTMSWGWQLRFFSWSTAALVIGLTLLWVARRAAAESTCPSPSSPSVDCASPTQKSTV
jgi:hypothetical protein